MSIKEYVSKTRKSFNNWVKDNLPCGDILSTPLYEASLINRAIYPISSHIPFFMSGLYLGYIAKAFTFPSTLDALNIPLMGAVTILSWYSSSYVANEYKKFRDSLINLLEDCGEIIEEEKVIKNTLKSGSKTWQRFESLLIKDIEKLQGYKLHID